MTLLLKMRWCITQVLMHLFSRHVEGYGRPYMEAMAMALPTVGTRWSSQTSFMDDTNSYLVDINGVPY